MSSSDSKPLFSFGVIADIQYADVDDGSDFSGIQKRYFRNTLKTLEAAIAMWNTQGLKFVLNLGDIIDGRNSGLKKSKEALRQVLDCFSKGAQQRVDIIGNHELYNFPRESLQTEGLNCVDSSTGLFYYALDLHPKWKLVVMDAYEISTLGYPSDHALLNLAMESIKENCPACLEGGGKDWFAGLPEEKHRFVPYNGAVSAAQLQWLQVTLAAAKTSNQSVIVALHIPLYAPATTPKTVLWNAEDVLAILHAHTNVVAVLTGHDHDGGYALDSNGLHHVTCCSPLCTVPGIECAGIVECYDGWALLKANGRFVVESATKGKGRSYHDLRLTRGGQANAPSGEPLTF